MVIWTRGVTRVSEREPESKTRSLEQKLGEKK
jgi:hypothetical protein